MSHAMARQHMPSSTGDSADAIGVTATETGAGGVDAGEADSERPVGNSVPHIDKIAFIFLRCLVASVLMWAANIRKADYCWPARRDIGLLSLQGFALAGMLIFYLCKFSVTRRDSVHSLSCHACT